MQAVLQEFPLCNGFQFLQVHTSNPVNASEQLRLILHGEGYIAAFAGQTVGEGMAVGTSARFLATVYTECSPVIVDYES